MSKGLPDTIRVAFVRSESGFWYAQGLDLDVAAQGKTLQEVAERWALTMDAELQTANEFGNLVPATDYLVQVGYLSDLIDVLGSPKAPVADGPETPIVEFTAVPYAFDWHTMEITHITRGRNVEAESCTFLNRIDSTGTSRPAMIIKTTNGEHNKIVQEFDNYIAYRNNRILG